MSMVRFSPGRAAIRPVKTGKLEVSIWDLLVWAFRSERASIEFDEIAAASGARPGVGMEYILMQRHNLGCQVDGGGRSDPHPDADLVASAVAALPEGCGGRQMAIHIAEAARQDRLPLPPERPAPRCEPASVRRCKHGVYAERSFWKGDARLHCWPRNQLGRDDGYVCLVRYSGTAQHVGSERRQWLLFRLALLDLRTTFQIRPDLSAFIVTDELPSAEPWKEMA